MSEVLGIGVHCVDVLFIEAVQKPVQVVSYEEFEQQSAPQKYFSRASFDGARFEPPIEEWEKACVCNQPLNPDRAYILCDVCGKWFHMECMKVTPEEAEQLDKYACRRCAKSP